MNELVVPSELLTPGAGGKRLHHLNSATPGSPPTNIRDVLPDHQIIARRHANPRFDQAGFVKLLKTDLEISSHSDAAR